MELDETASTRLQNTSIAEEHMNGLGYTKEEDEEDEENNNNTVVSNDARSKLEVNVLGSHANESNILTTPTSPRSVTTISMSASDDMVEHENERLRDRVSDLEKRVHDQNDEITCLRATLADALRRINSLESDKGHVQVISTSHPGVRLRRDENYNSSHGNNTRNSGSLSGLRRPLSGTGSQYEFSPSSRGGGGSHHESVNRRSALYQSTGSLHSDGHSSNSMSPAPSPSPTHNQIRSKNNNNSNGGSKLFSTPSARPHQSLNPSHENSNQHASTLNNNRSSSLSGSMTNLTNSKKWNSTSDFRDHSPGPNNVPRRNPGGSLLSLRSPFGSQQNLDRSHRHGTKDAVYNPDEGSVNMYIRGRPTTLWVPSGVTDSYSLSKVSPAPPQKNQIGVGLRIPRKGRAVQLVPPSYRGNGLLCCGCCCPIQFRGTDAETLLGTHGRCKMSRCSS
eukprot:TRINITY_DN815_c0_g1_i1.p2 TRINITY_DN815_c0_g1~~TRINITY_DN815_c0_g1_i1.p2  ORF type:complete len:449 (-),score=82.12 TRINITY_DN815_c0_g1_i1:2051-3397(-)